MDESLQEIIALTLVALAVALELLRRYRKNKSGKVGCDGCDTGKAAGKKEAPLRFYKRN